jgi:hypothetical protein
MTQTDPRGRSAAWARGPAKAALFEHGQRKTEAEKEEFFLQVNADAALCILKFCQFDN